MTDKFEERLATALTHTLGLNPEQVAATLIAQGIVADPVQHQEDLVAIMDKQVRDSEGWSDEFVTSVNDPMTQNPDYISSITDYSPDWNVYIPTWHRRVTAWREVHRA